MKTFLLATVLLALSAPVRAQFASIGDQQVTGQMGVGTYTPRATLDVMESSSDNYALWIASQNGAALLVVNSSASVGIGTSSPTARVDVAGAGDSGDVGIQLRAGNSSTTYSSSQILFSYGGLYPHQIVTRGTPDQYWGNDIDFFLWNSTAQPTIPGTLQVMSLQAAPSASTASVHIMPVGTPDYELVVSNGQTTGGGSVMAANVSAHSSRDLKTVTAALGKHDDEQAYADVNVLRPARFRYRGRTARSQPVRGLIFEDSPASIREERGQSISVEARIANMEMALTAANRRIKDLEKKIAEAERGGRR